MTLPLTWLFFCSGKDMRVIVFAFRPRTKQVDILFHSNHLRKLLHVFTSIYLFIYSGNIPVSFLRLAISSFDFALPVLLLYQIIMPDILRYTSTTWSFQKNEVFDALRRYTKPANLWDLYAFSCDPTTVDKKSDPKSRLSKEYNRLFSKRFPNSGCGFEVEKDSMHKNLWRLTTVNSSYSLCSTYPSQLIVPKSIRYFSPLVTSCANFCSLKHMLNKSHTIFF
jgi:hypothetical protein